MATESTKIEYKHRPVVFCPVCKNCCESSKDPELGLVVHCPGCQYKETSKEAVVYQSGAKIAHTSQRLPQELSVDPTRPLVRQQCPTCQHPWARKIQKDSANPYGELGALYLCVQCKKPYTPVPAAPRTVA